MTTVTMTMVMKLFTTRVIKFFSNVKKDSQITLPSLTWKLNASATMKDVLGRKKIRNGTVSTSKRNRLVRMKNCNYRKNDEKSSENGY